MCTVRSNEWNDAHWQTSSEYYTIWQLSTTFQVATYQKQHLTIKSYNYLRHIASGSMALLERPQQHRPHQAETHVKMSLKARGCTAMPRHCQCFPAYEHHFCLFVYASHKQQNYIQHSQYNPTIKSLAPESTDVSQLLVRLKAIRIPLCVAQADLTWI